VSCRTSPPPLVDRLSFPSPKPGEFSLSRSLSRSFLQDFPLFSPPSSQVGKKKSLLFPPWATTLIVFQMVCRRGIFFPFLPPQGLAASLPFFHQVTFLPVNTWKIPPLSPPVQSDFFFFLDFDEIDLVAPVHYIRTFSSLPLPHCRLE